MLEDGGGSGSQGGLLNKHAQSKRGKWGLEQCKGQTGPQNPPLHRRTTDTVMDKVFQQLPLI